MKEDNSVMYSGKLLPEIPKGVITIVSIAEDHDKRLRYLEEPYLYYRGIHIQHEQEQLKKQQ